MARGQTRPPPRSQTALRRDWVGTQRVRASFPYRRNLLPTRSQDDPRETDISGWCEYAPKIRQAKSVRIAHIFAMNRCNTPARRFNCRLNCDNVSSGRTRSPWRPCGLNPSHAMRRRRSRYLPSCFVISTLDVVSADIDRIHAHFSSETSQRLCPFFGHKCRRVFPSTPNGRDYPGVQPSFKFPGDHAPAHAWSRPSGSPSMCRGAPRRKVRSCPQHFHTISFFPKPGSCANRKSSPSFPSPNQHFGDACRPEPFRPP